MSRPNDVQEHTTGEQTDAHARTATLLKQLEAGVAAIQQSDDFKRVLATAAKFHAYSFNNVLLIMTQCPHAQRVAGYKTWQSLGRHVRKGEHAIYILAPRPYRVMRENEATGDAEIEREGITFRAVAVFDISQTDGPELPSFEVHPLTSDAGQHVYQSLVMFAEAQGLTVTNTDANIPATEGQRRYNGYYHPHESMIYVKPAAPAQMVKTLIHELAHHLDEELINSAPDERETVAEAAAYVVAAYARIDTSAYSFPYIVTWAGRADGSAIIKAVMARVQRITDVLVAALHDGDKVMPNAEALTVQPSSVKLAA